MLLYELRALGNHVFLLRIDRTITIEHTLSRRVYSISRYAPTLQF